MGIFVKNYRLFWITETKEIINNYKDNYSGSMTMYPDDGPNSYFESDNYQDILDKIDSEGLVEQTILPPIE